MGGDDQPSVLLPTRKPPSPWARMWGSRACTSSAATYGSWNWNVEAALRTFTCSMNLRVDKCVNSRSCDSFVSRRSLAARSTASRARRCRSAM